MSSDDVDQLRRERNLFRSLLIEAYRELACIEAITVSPSGPDSLLDLVSRMREAIRGDFPGVGKIDDDVDARE